MYRSRDKEFMNELKVRVLDVTKGLPKEDRKYAIDYLRTHVRIDDLYALARRKFRNKTFEFGSGSYNPKIVVVTKDPISPDHVTKLSSAWRKLGIGDNELFYAHLRFVKTKKKQKARQDLFDKLINILSPVLVVAFDSVTVNTDAECYDVGESIRVLSDPKGKAARKELTSRLRNYKKEGLI